MDNPVLVEIVRGGLVESSHRGVLAVVDADGGAVMTFGDIGRPVFPRSAVKALQALPLVESGAADDFTGEELRLRAPPTAVSPATWRRCRRCWRAAGSTLRRCVAARTLL